ncbi:hypothetical protein LshimejAT787_0602090 [Lyophyllum shimeji]|uniref:Uncharacterized protein n=1 Tax=Lyophyllum shimeji TaxID=47721 RepID=A0A9P3PPJ9_LYOSH|nr:hypothetical protein LshimejAT787_0602090 [Lyophyllum shimeji]
MHVPAFNTMLLALSAFQATAIPSYSPATSSVDKRTSALLAVRNVTAADATAAAAYKRPWDLNIQTVVTGSADFVASQAVTKISQMISLGDHVVKDETYLVVDDGQIPYVLMKNFIDHVVGVFSGYGVLAAQEHAIVGKPHFNFVWLGAEFRSNGYPTIRADVVASKNINYHMDVKIYQLDGSIYPMETSGSLKVETLSDKGYERVTFLG